MRLRQYHWTKEGGRKGKGGWERREGREGEREREGQRSSSTPTEHCLSKQEHDEMIYANERNCMRRVNLMNEKGCLQRQDVLGREAVPETDRQTQADTHTHTHTHTDSSRQTDRHTHTWQTYAETELVSSP